MKDYNYINISKSSKRVNILDISSKSELFKGRLTYVIDEYCIIFKRANIMDKKTIKPTPTQSGWFGTKIVVNIELDIDVIQEGKYYFDEDSDEDTAIIIYN